MKVYFLAFSFLPVDFQCVQHDRCEQLSVTCSTVGGHHTHIGMKSSHSGCTVQQPFVQHIYLYKVFCSPKSLMAHFSNQKLEGRRGWWKSCKPQSPLSGEFFLQRGHASKSYPNNATHLRLCGDISNSKHTTPTQLNVIFPVPFTFLQISEFYFFTAK